MRRNKDICQKVLGHYKVELLGARNDFPRVAVMHEVLTTILKEVVPSNAVDAVLARPLLQVVAKVCNRDLDFVFNVVISLGNPDHIGFPRRSRHVDVMKDH